MVAGLLVLLSLSAQAGPRALKFMTKNDNRAPARSASAPASDVIFEFLTDATGAPTLGDVCTTHAAVLSAGATDWACLRGDGTHTESGAGYAFGAVGTPEVSAPRHCPNGLDCAAASHARISTGNYYRTASTGTTTGSFSVFAVFEKDSTATAAVITRYGAGGFRPFLLRASTLFTFIVSDAAGATSITSAAGTVSARALTCGVATYESLGDDLSAMRLYNETGATGTPSTTAVGPPQNGAEYIEVGDRALDDTEVFPGTFHYAGYTNKVLTAAEAQAICVTAMGALTGKAGEVVTTTRASVRTCVGSDGTTNVIASNRPCVAGGGVSVMPGATNLALRCRDLSNATWVKSNATCTLTATGTGGTASTASTCTADAADATVLQTITTASASRSTSFHLKRRTGTGNVYVTRDNGTTWIDVTASVGAGWVRLTPVTHAGLNTTAANPIIGIKLATSGDAIDIDRVQDEAGAVATAPIDTDGSSVTRAADVVTVPMPALVSRTEGCIVADAAPSWTGSDATRSEVACMAATSDTIYKPVSSANIGSWDGVHDVLTSGGFVAGVFKTYRTKWSATGNQLLMRNVTDGNQNTSAFTTLPAPFANLYVGGHTSSNNQWRGTIKNLKMGKTAGACE